MEKHSSPMTSILIILHLFVFHLLSRNPIHQAVPHGTFSPPGPVDPCVADATFGYVRGSWHRYERSDRKLRSGLLGLISSIPSDSL